MNHDLPNIILCHFKYQCSTALFVAEENEEVEVEEEEEDEDEEEEEGEEEEEDGEK